MRRLWLGALVGLALGVPVRTAWSQVAVTYPRAEQTLHAGQPVRVEARLETQPGAGPANLTAVVTDPEGIEELVRLQDDGRAADETARDGVWSGLYRAGDKAGAYQVVVKALVGGRVMWSPRSAFSLKPLPEAPPPPVRRWPAVVAAVCALGVGVVAGALIRRRPASPPVGSQNSSAPAKELV